MRDRQLVTATPANVKVGYEPPVATSGNGNAIRYHGPSSSSLAQSSPPAPMPKKRRQTPGKKSRPTPPIEPTESRAGEAVTIAWTSTVTAVLVADLIVIAAHLYARANPEAQ